ncbi:ceramide-1-phosphate transfer protein isoform X1 [Latimeria chalumnae]|uniref:ceramide-1-phosphate transfer protein isoform X1 n=3 Tax=Latimeria chalumnae TaxID=7897 RepID=UPI0006D91237|nr:PREDICTED: ceramide-1-phosphate transfer protein isoform X2 [Latimeria chalumnae]|eukprot:XP_014343315.1 PREDICTED: ceramide-1-phosphate transfer protein isoform X2 [Latimeria chalumnae]
MQRISYSAASEVLSNKRVFPSFLRTFPSDEKQAEAMVELLKEFQWSWIVVIGSDTEYSRRGKQELIKLAPFHELCIAYHRTVSTVISKQREEIAQVISIIVGRNVKVVLVFGEVVFALNFFTQVTQANVTGRVWIASMVWATDQSVADIPNFREIGTVLGIAPQPGIMTGFDQFVSKAVYQRSRCLPFLKARWVNDSAKGICNKFCEECQSLTAENILDIPEKRSSFRTYSAVYAVAHALHQLLGCDSGKCQNKTFFPWQLLEKVKTVNFSLYDKLIYFNEKGEAPTGYDIVMWNWTGESVSFDTIGTYSVKLGKVDLDARLINWPTEGNTAPVSVCSEDCLPGQKRKQAGPNICCFYCLTCPEGTYLNQSNLYECRSCHKDQWAPEGSPMCYERTKEYLSWKNNISLVLVSISTLGLVLTAAASIFFTVNLNTPVVKAAGGKLCLFMLVCLACCYCSVCLFIGKPTYVTCILRQLVFPISYTACLSCLVLRSFQIMCIFKMAARLPVSFDYWVKHNGQYIFIYMVTAVQIFLACFWIGISDNEPLFDYHFKDAIVLKCGEYTTRAIITEVAYTGLLSALCFIFSYTGEELPRNYNEAKCITFTMLIYFISIICYFMFDKAQSERNTTMWLVICILARLYGILGGYFFPKCYIILFKPKQNTAAFFRACIQNYTN